MSAREVSRVPRRAFLVGALSALATGGLALAMFESDALAANPPEKKAAAEKYPRNSKDARDGANGFSPNVFVHIQNDGHVHIVCHRSEMGQGIRSSLPVLIADEIGADMAHVTIIQGDGDEAYGDQNTDGSTSVRKLFDDMRKVGATARTMLVAVAAQKWGVSASECSAKNSEVSHAKSKRVLPFSALVESAAKLPVPKLADVTPRPMSEWSYAGRELPLIDGADIVTGRAAFGADVQLHGMLIAVILRPPVVGARAKTYDPAPALAVKGVVRVVDLPAPTPPYKFQPLGGVAVLAENTWAAMRGRAALHVEWERADNDAYDSDTFREVLLAQIRKPGRVVRKTGDAEAALEAAAKKIDAEYITPHLAHAPMEPPAAIARLTENGCEVWACTQSPQDAAKEVATALGLDVKKVRVHVTMLGGAFGRKSKPDFIVEAALLARSANVPVRVQWTREDDVHHDYFHTTCAQKLTAGLDADGKIVAWRHRTVFPPIGSTFTAGAKSAGDGELNQGVTDVPLAIPNVLAENGEASAMVRIGWLRSVNNIHHGFAKGSFIDELAFAKNQDPKDTWLEILGPPRRVTIAELGVPKLGNYGASLEDHPIDTGRMRRVIERVCELSDFSKQRKNGKTADGRGAAMGLAAHRSFLTNVGVVVEVARDSLGKIHVERAWVVVDAGIVINPDRVRSQMEGAIIFGTSIALKSEITVRGGSIVQSNFNDYKLARIEDAPREIHVDIIASDAKPGGIGEPGVPPVAPAIVNAVFALTGTRVRQLPLSRSGF